MAGLLRSLPRPLVVAEAVGAVLWLPTVVDILTTARATSAHTTLGSGTAGRAPHARRPGGWSWASSPCRPSGCTSALEPEPSSPANPALYALPIPVAAAALVARARSCCGALGRATAAASWASWRSPSASASSRWSAPVGGAFYYRLRWVDPADASALIVTWAPVAGSFAGGPRRPSQPPWGDGALGVVVARSTCPPRAPPVAPGQGAARSSAPSCPRCSTRSESTPAPASSSSPTCPTTSGAWYARARSCSSSSVEASRQGPARSRDAVRCPPGARGEPVQARLVVVFDQVVEALRKVGWLRGDRLVDLGSPRRKRPEQLANSQDQFP